MPLAGELSKKQAEEVESSVTILEETESESSAKTMQEAHARRGPWVSLRGAIVHSLVSWPQGKFEDTLIVNPAFDSPVEYSIYCIHGTGDRSYAFGKLMNRLLDAEGGLPKSISKIYLLAFDGRYQGSSIDSFSDQLKNKMIKNKDKHVVLFGHSRGGLVAAKFAQDMAKDIGVTVHAVLAFCSPFYGSPLAIAPLALFSNSVAQMTADSEFLTTLRSSITSSAEEGKKYYYFAVENDSVVPTNDSFIKEHANAIILVPDHGHLSILTSSVLVGYVSDCLQQITSRPRSIEVKEQRIRKACLELEAEIFALKNRYHLYSSEGKLKILTDLKYYLSEMCEGRPSQHFPEARTIGDFVRVYLDTLDASTGLTLRHVMTQQLNPNFYFFNVAPSRSIEFMEHLITAYHTVPLPERDDSSKDHSYSDKTEVKLT